MNEQKEMPAAAKSPSPRFRYWFTPPESVEIKVSDIEPFVPKANWKIPAPAGLTVGIPADKVFSKNVPRITLRLLAGLLPDHVSSSDGMVKLPADKLAASYRLVQHQEELVPEVPPAPEKLPEPEPPAKPESAAKPEEKAAGEKKPEPSVDPAAEPVVVPEPVAEAPARPAAVSAPEPAPAAPPIGAVVFETPSAVPAAEEPKAPPFDPPKPALEEKPPAPSKFPARRLGSFVGLPLFRRKAAAPQPAAAPPAPLHTELPPPKFAREPRADGLVFPAAESQSPAAAPEPVLISVPPPPEELPVSQIPPAPEPPAREPLPVEEPLPAEPVSVVEPVLPPPPAAPVRVLRTEHFPRESKNREIVEQEPLQALFLTEETMTVSRVIELCGCLPGINSCVLAHGSIVVASHNVPDGVDLVSMSAHASDMLKAMRDSSARMGVGTVPAVTLHTEKGVISFFNREDLTMLVFHRDRGFIPGVREKMAAVLGELTKARLTLPVGSEDV